MSNRNQNNSTDYVHPQESNLFNVHTAMQYNNDGQPVLRTHVDGISLAGDVIVDKVKLWDGTNNLIFDLPNNDGETAPWSMPTESHNMVFNGTTWDRLRGNTTDGVLTKLTNSYLPISKDTNANATDNRIYVTTDGTVELGTTTLAALETITVNQGTGGSSAWKVDIGSNGTVTANVTFPTVYKISKNTSDNSADNRIFVDTGLTMFDGEIKNEVGNPIPISKNTTTNSSSNPIFVSNEGSTVVVGDLPAASLTAFDEPFAVGITPVIQADAIYGLDPDFWVKTSLNGGSITLTDTTTWQVQSGTSAGGYARLATSKYMTYQPGQGSMFRWTAAFTTTGGTTKDALGIDNIVQNTGPIDREDGYSFGYSGSTANDASRKIGILHRRAGRSETRKLTITTAPTGNQTAVITLNGVAYTISLTASTSVNYTANQIANALNAITAAANTWDIEGCSGVVTFTYYSPGVKNGTYSFSSSGTGTIAVGAFSQVYAGSTPDDTWTYVDDWDNKTIQFDPTKLNVFGVDLRWLGAGRVRFFMEDPSTGKMVLVHTQRWSGQHLYPHINKPSLRIIYRSGTTNPAITPSQNVIVTGASVFAGIQGMINQTGSSQGWYSIDSTSRAKDIVWHLMSIQNPYVRNNGVNKASIQIQSLTVAAQGNDPSVVYVVKDAVGLSDVLAFSAIPNTTESMFAQYSTSLLTENLLVDRVCNIQTLGINGTATFDLSAYNLSLSPGEHLSVFISSSNAITRTATGMTWKID